MIELIVYPQASDQRLLNNSPFYAKTEFLLKLGKIPYKVNNFNGNPSKLPNKKLPVILDETDQICDSADIQDYLIKKYKLTLDENLSQDDHALGFAFTKMLEEYFYWALYYERWIIEENWVKVRDGYFGHIPKLIRGVVTSMIRKGSYKSMIGHGMGRHSEKEVLRRGKDCLKVLSKFLSQKRLLLGDQVSTYDTSIYAFVSNAIHSPLGPEL